MRVFSSIVLALLVNGCSCNPDVKKEENANNASNPAKTESTETAKKEETAVNSELKMEDIKVGTGAEAVDGKTLEVHYTGTLTDGTKFDSSKDRNSTFSFVLGEGRVIKGWDQGMKGMKVGGIRKLTIPSDLAYGDEGIGGTIPPKATLIFEVELINVN